MAGGGVVGLHGAVGLEAGRAADLHDHGHAQRLELLHQGGCDLGRHPLLNLQAAGINFNQPRQLGQPDYVMARQVGDMRLAHEGQQVMLAQRVKINVAADDNLLVVFLDEERAVDHFLGVLRIAASQVLVGLDDPGWCAQQPFTVGVFADVANQTTNRALCRFHIFIHVVVP